MRKNLGFRAWFYFRQGWSTYFAFIFAAINTMVVTYYLAIKDVPILKEIFPSFIVYLVVLSAIGIPLLTYTGYLHYKKSSAYKAEAEITIESHPYFRKMLTNTEAVFPIYISLLDMMVKISKNEKLSDDDLKKISELKSELDTLIKTRYLDKSSSDNK